MPETLVPIKTPLDLRATLSTLRNAGFSAPVSRWDDSGWTTGIRTPEGPASVRLTRREEGVVAVGWGPGADWALGWVPRWLGVEDNPQDFEPEHPFLKAMHRKNPGLRFGYTGRVFDSVMFVVFEQKVTTKGATASRGRFYRKYGEPAPGPGEVWLPPSPATVKTLAYFHLHPLNVERKRAQILLHAARVAKRLEETVTMSREDARRRLQAVRGIGPWTIGNVVGPALGDPDSVPIGDYHLKNYVAYALAGEPRATDERMMELLAPYAGHQRRVVGLVEKSGQKAPRYGPRTAVNNIRDH